MAAARSWDIFCKVIDNHGDLGVCWRLAHDLAGRSQRVTLWIDEPGALDWMAPTGADGVEVLRWQCDHPSRIPGDVLIEAFGCEPEAAFVNRVGARRAPASPFIWLNLEYLSAEAWVERCHGLRSPVLSGPGQGLEKFFFYPGFTEHTGGLLREPDLIARQARFDRHAWLKAHGIDHRPHEQLTSLFCYEPQHMAALLGQLAPGASQTEHHLLVTPGRAAGAVQSALAAGAAAPRITWLPPLPQTAYDELLWACDLNFVRGEDSFVRALWAGKPFVWNIYPQHDDAHHAKLDAFLRWMDAPLSLREFSFAWNDVGPAPLPPVQLREWASASAQARARALASPDLATQLITFVDTHAAAANAPPAGHRHP